MFEPMAAFGEEAQHPLSAEVSVHLIDVAFITPQDIV